jgi:hypothetical protein
MALSAPTASRQTWQQQSVKRKLATESRKLNDAEILAKLIFSQLHHCNTP